jgi:hypothetical protein
MSGDRFLREASQILEGFGREADQFEREQVSGEAGKVFK